MGEAKGKSKDWYNQNCKPKGNIPLAYYRPFPTAETFEELYNRTAPILDEVLSSKYENIIIVGHGGGLTMFLFQWLRIPVESMENIAFEASSGGISFLSLRENKRMLNKYNVTSYKDNK